MNIQTLLLSLERPEFCPAALEKIKECERRIIERVYLTALLRGTK